MESLSQHPQGAPGSPAAVANGCTCPTSDNAHGKGFGSDADGGLLFYVMHICPVHDNGKTSMTVFSGE